MCFKPEPKLSAWILVQSWKADRPIYSSPAGKVTVVNALQPLKAYLSMRLTVSGRVIALSEVQFLKALLPMAVTVQSTPSMVTWLGMVMLPR